MNRPLTYVALTGIAISILSFTAAGLLVPGQQATGTWLDDLPWPPGIWEGAGSAAAVPLRWEGGGIEVSIPGEVRFRRAPDWHVAVDGPSAAIQRLRLVDGHLYLHRSGGGSGASSLAVTLAGPSLDRITVNGSGDVRLEDLAQASLDVEIRGSGTVAASGQVGSLVLMVLGSGDADLGGLVAGDLDATIIGSGDAEVSPTGEADVRIIGSGNLRLRARPARLTSRITGSGEVIACDPCPGQVSP